MCIRCVTRADVIRSTSNRVQQCLHLPPGDTVLGPRSLQRLAEAQDICTFPGPFLPVCPLQYVPHLLLDGVNSRDRNSTVAVDLARTLSVSNLDELEADVEGLGKMDGIHRLVCGNRPHDPEMQR